MQSRARREHHAYRETERHVRDQVRQLCALGSLPPATATSPEHLRAYETLLSKVTRPLSDDEARALVVLFGPDDCYGLAWTLLHLIETAPGWPLPDCLQGTGEWIETLRSRARRGGKLP